MKYSKEKIAEIVANISKGATNKDSAQLADIAEDTFYEWMKKKEFSEPIKKAKAKRRTLMINRILIASNKTWQAAAWYLERTEPEDFGRHREMEVKGDGEIIVTIKDYE